MLGEEQGKVRADAEGELMRGLETLEVACAGGLLLKGELTEQVATGVDAFSSGCRSASARPSRRSTSRSWRRVYLSSIALACGNAVIVKPSERVPSASVRLAELAAEAGLPAGVLNVVQGDRVVVDAILDHPGIAAVSFIGSSAVARHVYARGSAAGKRVQAFGGAKNHMVVMPDADLTQAADAAVSAAYGSSGQRCMAVSVVVAVGGSAPRGSSQRSPNGPHASRRSRLGRRGRDGARRLRAGAAADRPAGATPRSAPARP